MGIVDQAKVTEIILMIPAHARGLAERLGLKRMRPIGSDLKRVDRHVIQPHEYKDIPDLSTPYWKAIIDRTSVTRGRRAPLSPLAAKLLAIGLKWSR
jgi:hypothetical protein